MTSATISLWLMGLFVHDICLQPLVYLLLGLFVHDIGNYGLSA